MSEVSWWTVSDTLVGSLEVMTTESPALMNSVARALPTPFDEPVMTTLNWEAVTTNNLGRVDRLMAVDLLQGFILCDRVRIECN